MDIPKTCDVVVIGGGPAGSMAATFLSRRGYEVVLLDRHVHPRYNVGESLIPHFWRYCDLADAAGTIGEEGFVRKAGGTVVWNGVIRQIAFRDFGFTRTALHVERDRFDHLLLAHSRRQGARVFEGVTVLAANLPQDGQLGRVTYRVGDERVAGETACRWIVDASGQHAVLAKQLGIRVIDEGFRFMSVWGYFQNSKYVAGDGRVYPFDQVRTTPPTTFVSSVGELGEWGWVWHIPLRETTSVGLVVPLEKMKEIKATEEGLEEYFLRTCRDVPHLNRLLEGARLEEGSVRMIRDYAYRPIDLTGPGFFLTGDAAAFIDPIFSVGVVLAMYSANLATWAIDRSFRHPHQRDRYQAIFASQFRGRLEVARSLALPRYRATGSASDLARLSVQFESSIEQELMYVVSTVTTRNENFVEMARGADGGRITSSRFRVLDEIVF